MSHSNETVLQTIRDKFRSKAGLALSVLALAGGALLDGCGGGTSNVNPPQKAYKEAVSKYETAFHEASPAGKFVLQYLTDTTVDIYGYKASTSSISGTDVYDYDFEFGEDCLENSAYNIQGGTINLSAYSEGIFSISSATANANIPADAAFAYVNPDNSNTLIITSGNAHSRDLALNGVSTGGQLVPANQQTKNVLYTYGCDEADLFSNSYNDVDTYESGSLSSPYIN